MLSVNAPHVSVALTLKENPSVTLTKSAAVLVVTVFKEILKVLFAGLKEVTGRRKYPVGNIDPITNNILDMPSESAALKINGPTVGGSGFEKFIEVGFVITGRLLVACVILTYTYCTVDCKIPLVNNNIFDPLFTIAKWVQEFAVTEVVVPVSVLLAPL